jgi:hypothetical protein
VSAHRPPGANRAAVVGTKPSRDLSVTGRKLHRTPLSIAALLLAAALGGCMEERVLGMHYGNMGDVPKKPDEQKRETVSADVSTEIPWAIALDMVTGPQHKAIAEQRRAALATQSAMKDLWVSDEADSSIVYFGKYPAIDDKQAQIDLRRWRELQARGLGISTCMLVPVKAIASSLSPFDLHTVAGKAAYTLQIGFYDEAFGKNFRQAAEQAVAILRKDGAQAYFYHGPHRSMVTVGLFGEDATVAITNGQFVTREYGPAVVALQQKYPYNFGNGSSIVQKAPGGKTTTQPSFLVQIPK